MKRLDFLKKLFTVSTVVAFAPAILASETTPTEFKFTDVFKVHEGNPRLIYPLKDSVFYKDLLKTIGERINENATATYLPVHQLYLPVKDKYTLDDLKPIKFYFENVYSERAKFSTQYDVVFRMIRTAPDRMHLDVFLNYRY